MIQFVNQYVNAHLKWITKLTTAIYGGEIPDKKVASLDNACDLGKWIHEGENRLFENLKEFYELREKHKQFHLVVGEILDLVEAGKIDQAKVELASGEFKSLSVQVINLISRIGRSAY